MWMIDGRAVEKGIYTERHEPARDSTGVYWRFV